MTVAIENLLHSGSPGDVSKALDDLRQLAMTTASGFEQTYDGMCSYRVPCWLLFLHTQPMPYEDYAALLERGASPAYSKIQNDVHRTLTSDPYFPKRVTQAALTRLLNTTAWSTYDRLAAETPLPPSPTLDAFADEAAGDDIADVAGILGSGSLGAGEALTAAAIAPLPPSPRPEDPAKQDLYVQGMNVLAAPFLYVSRSEATAFSLFNTLLREQLPSYFMPGLAGVHLALTLLDEVMALVDPELKAELPPANIYAFGPVMTLCASIPPLSEVLKLWDFLLASGPHMGVLAVVAVLIGMRGELIGAEKASARLRNLGLLDAASTIRILREVVMPRVVMDDALCERLIRHTHPSAVQRG